MLDIAKISLSGFCYLFYACDSACRTMVIFILFVCVCVCLEFEFFVTIFFFRHLLAVDACEKEGELGDRVVLDGDCFREPFDLLVALFQTTTKIGGKRLQRPAP